MANDTSFIIADVFTFTAYWSLCDSHFSFIIDMERAYNRFSSIAVVVSE